MNKLPLYKQIFTMTIILAVLLLTFVFLILLGKSIGQGLYYILTSKGV